MKTALISLVVLLLPVLALPPAGAASRDQLLFPPELFRSGDVQVGQWVEYEVTWADGEVELVKFSIVGTKAETEEPDARELFWLEVKYAPKEGPEHSRKLLRALIWPADYSAGQMPLPARCIISMASGTAADFKPENVKGALAFLVGPSRDSKRHWVRNHTAWMAGASPSEETRQVEVPAGTFTCKVLKAAEDAETQACICDEVPFWGLVEMSASVRGWGVPMTMVLTGFGTDAKSEIDSAVVNIDPLLLPDRPPSEGEDAGEAPGEGA